MLDVLGRERVLKNFKSIASLRETGGLRNRFLQALAEQPRQRDVPMEFAPENWLSTDDRRTNRLRDTFATYRSAIDDLDQAKMILDQQVNSQILSEMQQRVRLARNELKRLHPEFYGIHEFAVHSVFFSHSNQIGGRVCNAASSSNSIGVIFLNADLRLSVNDLMELLVHETTHTLIFIDELCNPQFDYEYLLNPSYFAKSAILNKPRPLDKVVHSIVVAIQVSCFRIRASGEYNMDELHAHPSSSTLMKQTLDAINDVKSMPNSKASKVMTPHTLRLIDKCQAKMEELVEC